MNFKSLVTKITVLHRDSIESWQEHGIFLQESGVLKFVEENHAFNFQLWNAEDRARRDDKGPAFVYEAKREIDSHNQERNNRMELLDEWFYQELSPAMPEHSVVHSETPGMIIDRLSILALKSYHMHLQTKRTDVDQNHIINCRAKHEVIVAQLTQLASCLEKFLEDVASGTRTFRVYHQFKMYNDPALNPELYA